MQLFQENQQINAFINDWHTQNAAEAEAEARHLMLVDVIYTEARMHIQSSAAHAGAEHVRRLGFVQQGTHALFSQLNSTTNSEVACHEERQASTKLTSQNMALTTRALHFETALKHQELQTAQLRKSFDDNRSMLCEYVAERFEEKLQWEEKECFQRLKAEEMQHDELVTDLMDQNAELQAEAVSFRIELAEKRNSPTHVEAGAGVGEVFESEHQNPSPPQGIASAAAAQGVQGCTKPWKSPRPLHDS